MNILCSLIIFLQSCLDFTAEHPEIIIDIPNFYEYQVIIS